ncbi:Uncharacterised protein [Mycobacteroides abscessus subsp. abscessus]|nr:Uncharacterised protein [Mycobacteroides abscessus subsp. abscessus]
MINNIKIGNQNYSVHEVECVDKHEPLATETMLNGFGIISKNIITDYGL